MRKSKKESFFWASYSDLMTSLFFIMLVLFVLTIAMLHKRQRASDEQLNKIKEIENAVQKIDTAFFIYTPEFKKHILKIRVNFPVGSSNLSKIDNQTQVSLLNAGYSIKKFIDNVTKEYPQVQYLLIIEGQASNDSFSLNYELSYERALALKKFWDNNKIDFGNICEVLISGSGDGKLSGTGFMREKNEISNQRFLIHIIPKPGIIENVSITK